MLPSLEHLGQTSLSQLIEIWETILHGSVDEEPVNSSLPDDAEEKKQIAEEHSAGRISEEHSVGRINKDKKGKKIDTSRKTNNLPRQRKAKAPNATKDTTALRKAIEQTLKASDEHPAQFEADYGPDKRHREEFVQNYKKLFSVVKNSDQAGVRQMAGIGEMMQHVLIDKEPVDSSLPDDAEVDSPNNSQ